MYLLSDFKNENAIFWAYETHNSQKRVLGIPMMAFAWIFPLCYICTSLLINPNVSILVEIQNINFITQAKRQ